MIVADRKKVSEIRDMVKDHKKVLLVGCGTCVTVCLAGGERETGIIGSALRMSLKLVDKGDVIVDFAINDWGVHEASPSLRFRVVCVTQDDCRVS